MAKKGFEQSPRVITGHLVVIDRCVSATLELELKLRSSLMVIFFCRSANGIILCYDLTCRQSFESLQRWLDDVSKFAAPNVCKVLIG